MTTPNLFDQAQGKACTVNFAQDSIINHRAYGTQQCVIEFQCIAVERVPGLVYVSFTPKGKRKAVSITVHQDRIVLI